MSELLLGDEAVGLAAIDAGISGMFSYPGTPATEIMEFVARRTAGDDRVAARWSANEKVAYEEALGMSYSGKRAMVSMKHVGLNVAADPFVNSALTGAHGGLVCVVADDPGMHSSQNEQDTRFYGDFAKIPLMEPADQQQAYEMTREAFELSEKLGLPVLIRLVTRLSHSRAAVERHDPLPEPPARGPSKESSHWTLLPVNARKRNRWLLEMQENLLAWSEQHEANELALKGPQGIIATGIAANYVREVIGSDSAYSMLTIGTYPVPVAKIREIVNHCEDILLVEEGAPFVETQLTGLLGVPGKSIRGKKTGALPPDGEMSADRVRMGLGMEPTETFDSIEDLPKRPPRLCQGCPHCDTFQAMLDATEEGKRVFFSDIGCYTLGALPPYNAVDSCVDMGASISMALGAAKAGMHPVLCTIGDSTFTHSGLSPLLGAAAEDANMTVLILDNATVGMTGGQETFITGDPLVDLIRGMGVKEDQIVVFEPLPKNAEQSVSIIKKAIDHKGLTVLIARRACVQVAGKLAKAAKAKAAAK